MADVTRQHLFLTQTLGAMLLCPVIIIVMDNDTAVVMAQFGGSNRCALEVTAKVINVFPGMFCFLRK